MEKLLQLVRTATQAAPVSGTRSRRPLLFGTTGARQQLQSLRAGVLLLSLFGSWSALGQSIGADVFVPKGQKAAVRKAGAAAPNVGGGQTAAQLQAPVLPQAPHAVAAVPVAYARTSRIMLNSFGDTPLDVPLSATDADGNGTIASYRVTALPPAAAGVLRLGGVAVTTATVISVANADNLTFDPVAGYFGTAVFSYTARDNGGGVSAAVTYGIPVAKAACGTGVGQASELSFYARTDGEDWKINRQVTVGGATITGNPTGTPYTASAATTNIFFVSDQTGSMPGKGLVWAEDYSSSAAMTATSTLTFSRPLANFTLAIGDLDNGTGYTDELTLQGYDSNNNLVAITAANVKTGATNSFANNVFTGTGNSAGSATANAIATFPVPIVRLVMVYRNVVTGVPDPANQVIVFPAMSWCAQADIQTTLTGPVRAQAGSTVAYTSTTRNVSGDAVNSIASTVQLPTGLSGVTGGSYNTTTGLLTLPVISNLAAGASVAQLVGFTMPASLAVTATSAFTSTADDPTANNNTSTITTAQNRTSVASNVTNAPSILSSTTTRTNLSPFNASDPDATTGNTTLVSYTILSLPTAAQGTLYVNGVAATLNQVIAVPTSATPGAPGYQLSFVPNGTFAGTASFTYRATDDAATNSNAATYSIPVTAGADLVTTVNGSTSGVEGQAKTNSVTTTNLGPAAAQQVVPTITLSNRPPFSSVSVSNGTYDPATGIVTFNPIASLASGASVFNTVTLITQDAPSSFTLTGASTSTTADPTAANNNGTAPAAILTVTALPIGAAGVASACANPGRDGSPTISSNPNTYYPAANQTAAVNATSLTVDGATGSVLTPIAIGDLLLVIQMQGADIDASNTDSYGDGAVGGFASNVLINNNYTAGQYEYVVAASAVPVGGGTLTISTGLKYSYQNADAVAGSTGQRRFQIVRIPQYQNLTVSGVVTPDAWNGRTGGILALDVTGKLSFESGGQLDASGKGFRGGAGQKLGGTNGLSGTDYRTAAPATGTTTVGAHASKGEGIAGTPRYVTNGATLLDLVVDGYPNGSFGRGAPGNAGGGGTDANPTANDQNSGGGGGANAARGGRGGNTGSSNAAVGGETGGGFNFPSSNRLIMGGGGGAGTTNNGTGDAGNTGYASSGAPGGGIVLVRAGSVAGLGAIRANGGSASSAVANDGSGGGGAGGSIVLTARNTTTLGTLSMAANGGSGGSNSGSNGTTTAPFGPGGGGGGGLILTNAPVGSMAVAGGGSGTTAGGVAYGAGPAPAGVANNRISASIANTTAGINCSADVTASITAPAAAAAGQSVALATVFANNGGVDASTVTRTVTLSSGNASNPFTAVSAPGGTISGLNTSVVTITYPALATLAAGSETPFNLSYTAPGTAAITATATITTTTTPAPVTDNNTSVATTAITGFADVVSAVFGLNSSTTGRPTGMYAVVFANNGPAAAANVSRTLTLPAGATLTTDQLNAITAQGGNYNGGTPLVIDFGTLTTLNSRGASVFKFSYTASDVGGASVISSDVTTTTAEGPGSGPGAAPNAFSFPVTNNLTSDVATASITPSAATVVPGQAASFVLNFVNNGPGASINALRYATLSPNLSGVVVTDYDNSVLAGAYDAATGMITLPVVALVPNGGTVPVTIAFTAPAVGPVQVSASMSTASPSVSSGIFDNNQATASMSVTPIADVNTVISGPTTVVNGNLATFAILTTNQGVSPAAAVVQTVQLPSGLAAAGVFASNNGIYNSTTGVVTFPAVAVLASGVAINNTVSLQMPAAGFTATAAVTTTTGEAGATTNNNSAAAATASAAATGKQANLYTALNLSEKNVMPGASLTLTLETGNHGPKSALSVVRQLLLPPGLSVDSISGGGTYNATTGLLTFPALDSLASGSSSSNTVVLTAPMAGPLVAMASATAATSDPVPADNLVIRNIDVVKMADVATVLVGPGIASATQVPRFTVNTVNNGPVPARNVVQTVAIIAGFTLSEVTASGGGIYDPATGIITWPAVASLAVGAVRTYTYSYVAPAFKSTDAANPRTIVSQAGVTSTTSDGITANNTATLATEIKWTADVAIAVSGPTTAVVGNPITFTVSTINNGPAPAASVTTTARITTGLTNIVASGGGVYDIMTGIVTFPPILNQAAGASGAVTNTITLLVPDRPIIGISAAANVPATSNDINLADNAATLIIPVTSRTATLVDLYTSIVPDRTEQRAGQPVVFTVTATNGGTTASDMRQRVTLPAGLSNVAVTGSGGNPLTGAYDAASGGVTFPLATAQAGGTVLTYTITVNDPSNDPLRAIASLNGNFSDPAPDNNTQSVGITITPVADVTTRVSGPATMLPGGLAIYQVVTLNNGPSAAGAVVQTVQLPTGLTDIVVSGGGSYDTASGLVTFPTIDTQAVGKAGEASNTIRFAFPTVALTISGTVSSRITEDAGTTASNISTLTTTLTNQIPLANTFSNRLQAPIGNTATALGITALNGFDRDGTLASFTIMGLPAAGTGVLLLNGTPVAVNQVISLADAANLMFDPVNSFVGNAFFSYTATDNQGAVSAAALYTITTGLDNPALYTNSPLKGGLNAYQNGDVIASVFDANGGTYNALAAVTDNGVRTAIVSGGTLPEGTELDPATGQVRVFNRSLLLTGTYPVSITTTDANGGITTQALSFQIGEDPLPIVLTQFLAKAVGTDGRLTWATAQEQNNAGFDVERSFDGVAFAPITFVAGAGTSAQPRSYSFVDVGVGQRPGQVYYRLRQLDRKGKDTYSPVQVIKFAPALAAASATLYPNPAAAHTTLDLTRMPGITYQVTIVDVAGRHVQTHALAGGLKHLLAVGQLPGGAYLVMVSDGTSKSVLRLLKQ